MSVNYKPRLGDTTVIEKAILRGRALCVELLIMYHADVDCVDGFPVRTATLNNNEVIVNMLITAGADVNRRSIYRSAVYVALKCASFSIVSQLLKAGAILPDDALALAYETHIDSAQKVAFLNAWES